MTTAQQHLLETVTEICKLKTTTRPKVMQDELGKVYVFDCYHWSDECAYMLRVLCPNAVMSVESAACSLSGFAIVLQLQDAPHKGHVLCRRRMVGAVVITALVYGALAWLHAWPMLDAWPFSSSAPS